MPDYAMTPDELFRKVGLPDCPLIVDVCTPEDFAKAPVLVPSAQRFSFHEIDKLAPQCEGQGFVFICQKGLKLSQGSAAILRETGAQARFMEGGIDRWLDEGKPTIAANDLADGQPDARSRWLVGKVDPISIVTAWFIRRFFDRRALFLDVELSQTDAVADRFAARLALSGPEAIAAELAFEDTAALAACREGVDLVKRLWTGLVTISGSAQALRGRSFAIIDTLHAAQRANI